ncbi:MAG: tRNA(Ile)(2)-agmatinylcytidine synthase [Methanomicrobiales archaeon]|nr:tRNA(Ile)(2)-agmatinylcytidine synthase [Methanomicrobiales archaeon]MDI6875542.1 tRNA(Ile)(2)-agmatinylcytidine synthase [Methanomicrobiales archaeon]
MRIGIDDTDSPAGMCTSYIGAVLRQRLEERKFCVSGACLLRLNPNVVWKTRGNAAICIEAEGDPDRAFSIACACVEEFADFSAENTNPGVVVTEERIPSGFYYRAVQGFCEISEAIRLLETSGARYRGYKNRRGLVGATAAVASELPDRTYEFLAYRKPERWGTPRYVERETLFLADAKTYPHTWDTVDRRNDAVVCVPHTPDPVLYGIRGESPAWVSYAAHFIRSEEPEIEQIYATNQGTDVHLIPGVIGALEEGRSYRVEGTVASLPETRAGGHVSVLLGRDGSTLRCMAYEPTKEFRDVVRALLPGDRLIAAGSYKGGSLNLEKMCVRSLAAAVEKRPPLCPACGRRMTSAGRGKGFKCRFCPGRAQAPELRSVGRAIRCGWYEVPPIARRHLAKPLVRFTPAERECGDRPCIASAVSLPGK